MKKKKQTKKKKKNNNRINYVFISISVLIMIVIIITVILTNNRNKTINVDYQPYYTIESRISNIDNTKIADSPAIGWLRVQGTNIDTPIVKRTDKVEESVGYNYLWLSEYYFENENRKVIYGHNIRNVSSYPEVGNKDHIKFEQLVSFAYDDFAKENLYIQFSDGKEEKLYKIYAVTFNNQSEEYGKSYKKEELKDYIKQVKYNSIYNYDVDVNEDDELISLITCTRYFGRYEKTQFKVDARRVRKNEKINKYSVETNSNYDIIK